MIHNSSVGIIRLNVSTAEYDLQTLFTPQQETEQLSSSITAVCATVYYWIERFETNVLTSVYHTWSN